ncbi:hypothetical protein RHSIM_Rhsim04G0031600 [Rhododendron simsii]|uniref:RRM domain-containing protein n=1 Tax=Rhododendron simsii TaxID=118357 RepID=A0A834H208_RHOSS|nr:hypothetical protein RHSIM_Rhsim04G0031600 [Rhododendron simsii]
MSRETSRGGRDRYRRDYPPRSEEKSHHGRSKAPPSRHLWVGNLSQNLNENALADLFLQFGELESVAFQPGRSYAFINFKHDKEAFAAVGALQGFSVAGSPLKIEFAKALPSSSEYHFHSTALFKIESVWGKKVVREGQDNITTRMVAYGIVPKHPYGDITLFGVFFLARKRDSRMYDPSLDLSYADKPKMSDRNAEPPSEGKGNPSGKIIRSPKRDRGAPFHDFPQKGPFYDDPWDLPEEALHFHGAKKLKTDSFPPDNELPEYPFSGPEQAKHGFPRIFPDFPQPDPVDKNFEPGSFGYRQLPDRAMNLKQQYGERSDHWNAPYDGFQGGSGSLPANPGEWKRLTPDLHQPVTEEWKWEGTIAKGGTPVCQARCFPVGKALDMPLPEYLDCTARTGLDMLAKHYYQAASAWVVFFVPGSDADIGYYNEFMNYLGEKQRAAVAKLDETTTLFLVPPSDFSEKVLKVPGKLSISGVVLRLEHPGPNPGSSLPHPLDKRENNSMSYRRDASYPKPTSPPPGHFPSAPSFPSRGNSGVMNIPFSGNSATSSHGIGNMAVQETSSSSYTPRMTGLQPEQLVQLASSLLGQPRQSGGGPGEEFRQSGAMNHSENPYGTPQRYTPQNNQVNSELHPLLVALNCYQLVFFHAYWKTHLFDALRNLFSDNFLIRTHFEGNTNKIKRAKQLVFCPQQQQQQQQAANVAAGNQQMQTGNTQEEDADPQKRLQATLQLAAALLQQIQQGKGN